MITVSLCIVAKDEAYALERCILSAKDMVDEIIVVLTGCDVETRETAMVHTPHVYGMENGKDLIEAKNFCFEKATMDYILWMECDDTICEHEKQKFMALKQSMDIRVNAVTMLHKLVLDTSYVMSLTLRRVRLVKNSQAYKWCKGIGGFLATDGELLDTDIEFIGGVSGKVFNRKGIIIENCIELGYGITPKDMYSYAVELTGCKCYDMATKYLEKFLQQEDGLIENKLSACHKLANIYSELGEREKEIDAVTKAFRYAVPRAEWCCRLGSIFIKSGEYEKAAFWYESALSAEKPNNYYEFYNEDCWTWIPHIQLCVCYYHLGKYRESNEHNEIALSYRPNDDRMLFNREFMKDFFKQQESQSSSIHIMKNKPLKIVQVAPNFITVPPKNYGGIERVVYDITEELVSRGHEIYLYASHGSSTNAHLIPYQSTTPNISDFVMDTLPKGTQLIHDHTHASYVGVRHSDIPTICTIHDSRFNQVRYPVYVSSRALEVVGRGNGFCIYNGIDPSEYEFCDEKEDYLLFMGELRWHKGILHALDIAERSGQRLVVAGPVFYTDYFESEIKPRLEMNPNVQYIGSVGGKERQLLFKKARCMIFPTSWEEPFGLVMVEAMACGTPVVALANGAVPEVMGGFPQLICHSVDEMVQKVQSEGFPNPYSLREYVEKNFTVKIMTDRYIELYRKIIEGEV